MPDLSHPAIQRVIEVARRKGVELQITVFEESTHTAEEAAATVGADLAQIVKSLVFVTPEPSGTLTPIICLVSGRNRVDIARLAAILGEPSVRRATAREARDLTGFSIGGIAPIGHQRSVRIVMDPDLGRFPVVWAAAGTDTAVFPVAPATLLLLANATVAPIVEDSWLDDRREEVAKASASAPLLRTVTNDGAFAVSDGGGTGESGDDRPRAGA